MIVYTHIYMYMYMLKVVYKWLKSPTLLKTVTTLNKLEFSFFDALASQLFQGITGIRLSGGEKCYIKTQVKARLPDVETLNNDSMTFDLVG